MYNIRLIFPIFKGYKDKIFSIFIIENNMINFNELPNEIKFTIFQMNRKDTANEIRNNKIQYDRNVVQELESFFEETNNGYYDKEEEEEYNDLEYTFTKAVLECMLDSKIDSMQEENLDLYYEYQCRIAEAEEETFKQYSQLEDQ